MTHTRLWISAAIIAAVVLTSFALSVPRTRDVAEEPAAMKTVGVVPVVILRESFKKGVHTIMGSLDVPNACTGVTAQASMAGDASSTPSILVTVATTPSEGVCLQLPMRAAFQTEVAAPANLPLLVTVDGRVASTSAP